MLRLFALRDTVTKRLLPGVTFPSKPEARTERDRLNATKPGSVCITFGPDHRRFVK